MTDKSEAIELPELDVTADDWLSSAKKCGSILRNNEDMASIACRERQLLAEITQHKASLARISSLESELLKLRGGEVVTWRVDMFRTGMWVVRREPTGYLRIAIKWMNYCIYSTRLVRISTVETIEEERVRQG